MTRDDGHGPVDLRLSYRLGDVFAVDADPAIDIERDRVSTRKPSERLALLELDALAKREPRALDT
jgi:hypothetical protein